jgi:hypothetical protein
MKVYYDKRMPVEEEEEGPRRLVCNEPGYKKWVYDDVEPPEGMSTRSLVFA